MSQSSDLTDIKVSIGILKNQNSEIIKRQDSMERKIDGFNFVTVTEFDKFKADIAEDMKTFATKEEVKPVSRVFYAILVALSTGSIGFLFWLAQRGAS